MREIRGILEEIVRRDRFNGRAMYEQVQPILLGQISPNTTSIIENTGTSNYEYITKAMLRNVFLIELVNDKISSTKMETRWIVKEAGGKKQERFDQSDPRFCSFDDCCEIFLALTDDLEEAISNVDRKNLLKLYQQWNLVPYEIPLDYIRTVDETLVQIHSPGNIQWIWDDQYQLTLKLREILLNPEKNEVYHNLFSSILKGKIKVKTYLTDRVQTGAHKTDREKRWEVHPESVHFSLRRNCLDIELELIEQLCRFENFPSEVIEIVEEEGFEISEGVFKCPITLEKFNFEELEKEVETPFHGKSNFQVGHLKPLKVEGFHIKENMSWISAEGNRIQGDLTLEGVRNLLSRIMTNYRDAGIDLESTG